MALDSQKSFFSVANSVILICVLGVYGGMLAGSFESLLMILILLFGTSGYFVPMLIALAFLVMFSYSRNGTRLFTIVVFVVWVVALAVICGAWNIYQQANSVSTIAGYGYYGYSYSIDSAEVINSAGYIGNAVLDYLVGNSIELRPLWTVSEHMLAIITTMIGSILAGLVLLSYFVYSPKVGNNRGKRGSVRSKKVINIVT